ncbi:MAG: NlpC/P60 family protein [Paludibacter sp.]|nr:NlpC/P60 family protein [Paludibacter sp.]
MHPHIKLYFLIIGLCFFSVTNAQEQTDSTATTTSSTDITFNQIHPQQKGLITDSLISFAKKYLKKPYNFRPNPHVRFDCSGFSSYVYSQFGYTLKRSSAEQAKQFNKIDKTQLKAGDLVFFSGRRNNKHVGHVGIVVNAYENGKFDFIHSSNQSGIVISHSDENYYAKRYIKAGRVIEDNTTIAGETEYVSNTSNQILTNEVEKIEVQNTLPEPNPAIYHCVRKGDTLYSIARRYGITVTTLKKQNQLNSNKILPKQKLIITENAS